MSPSGRTTAVMPPRIVGFDMFNYGCGDGCRVPTPGTRTYYFDDLKLIGN